MSPNAPMDDLLDGPRRDRRQGGRTRGGEYPPGRPTYHRPLLILLSMKGHAFTAYLRVYQPLAAFPPRERAEWAAYVEADPLGQGPWAHDRRRARARPGRAGRGRGLPVPSPHRAAHPPVAGRLPQLGPGRGGRRLRVRRRLRAGRADP